MPWNYQLKSWRRFTLKSCRQWTKHSLTHILSSYTSPNTNMRSWPADLCLCQQSSLSWKTLLTTDACQIIKSSFAILQTTRKANLQFAELTGRAKCMCLCHKRFSPRKQTLNEKIQSHVLPSSHYRFGWTLLWHADALCSLLVKLWW